ncbi:amidase [Arthrobacter sp. M4]|uniref:amidase n=1 Tax=Arthrobacter sp. M4 TaxID=218160 RepID=UPI001CDC1A5F|nr:amidase [Arthrobacter sp. M4]MCA4133160.1 amidase [Arthrobacter sp. M4]
MEIHELSAVALRAALAAGEVSALEVTQHFLARIESANRLLAAFVTVTAEQAIADAKAADRAFAKLPTSERLGELPPFHGVPVAFKDLTDVAGIHTTHGSAALEHRPAPADSDLVARFRRAGAVSLGKTQVPEFGLTAYSENRIAPPSRNPHAPSRSSGGSSGGSAAAVAAGLVPFAPGSDGGGSIRIPAAACGILGLKPGRGLVPSGEGQGDPARLVVAGPLARTAADAALMLDVLAEPELAPGGGYLARIEEGPPSLTIGMTLDSPWQSVFPFSVEPEALEALRVGAELLAASGHRVVEASVRYDNRYAAAFTTAWTSGVGSARISPQREALLTPLTRTFRRRAQQRSAAKVNEAVEFLRAFAADTITQYAQWDVILTPALAQTPRPIGWFTGTATGGGAWPAADWTGDPDDDYRRQCEFAPWSSMVNVCGLPAIAVPVYWTGSAGTSDRGLPMGVQLIGKPGSELLLLQLAAQLMSGGSA